MLNPLKKKNLFFSSFFLFLQACGGTGVISERWAWFQFHACARFTPCWRWKGLVDPSLWEKKKIKMTWRAPTDIFLSSSFLSSSEAAAVLYGPLNATTDRSNGCPYRPQHRYRLTVRKRLLLRENVFLFAMPFSPSVSIVRATWDASISHSWQESWCKTSISDYYWVINHIAQMLICMEWMWSSDIQHPMIWNHSPCE